MCLESILGLDSHFLKKGLIVICSYVKTLIRWVSLTLMFTKEQGLLLKMYANDESRSCRRIYAHFLHSRGTRFLDQTVSVLFQVFQECLSTFYFQADKLQTNIKFFNECLLNLLKSFINMMHQRKSLLKMRNNLHIQYIWDQQQRQCCKCSLCCTCHFNS